MTDVFVEQVLIGFMVLLIVVSPFYREGASLLDAPLLPPGAAVGAGLIGLAYVLGIPADRFADSLTSRLEQHIRLRYAAGLLIKKAKPREKLEPDPYPEGRYRIAVWRKDGASRRLDYLRTRIRLSRATAVFTPGIIAALVVGLGQETDPSRTGVVVAIIPLVYVAGLLAGGVLPELPKTDDLAVHDSYARVRHLNGTTLEGAVALAYDLVRDPWIWVAAILLGLAAWMSRQSPVDHLTLLVAGGSLLTAGAAWTWWRISRTEMSFLRDFHRFAD